MADSKKKKSEREPEGKPMAANNRFDQKIEHLGSSLGKVPGAEHVRDAAIYVVDTLDLAIAASESVFENPSAEVVFQIYDRINAERQRLEAKTR